MPHTRFHHRKHRRAATPRLRITSGTLCDPTGNPRPSRPTQNPTPLPALQTPLPALQTPLPALQQPAPTPPTRMAAPAPRRFAVSVRVASRCNPIK
jgi:hypothetical protein